MKVNPLGAGIFTIEGFLSPQECVQYIAESEGMGYEEAAIRTDDGELLYKDARNNDRIILDRRDLAMKLFERARPALPAEAKGGWQLSSFNDRDDFEGGSTEFGWEKVKPVQSMALVFPHHLRHQGSVVTGGVKYVLRTDVMYRSPEA